MWLSPKKGQDDDTASIISTNEGGGKKRLFKRSTSRKPTGLASALAATGMAMANPSISALHAAQMSTAVSQQQSPARSQTEMVGSATSSAASPYMNKSPSTSVVSNGGPQRSATAMVGSPKSVKSAGRKVSSPGGSRKGKGRRPSVSAYSDGAASWAGTSLSVNGGGSEYYSGGESEGAQSRISRASRRSRGRGSGNESDTEDDSSDEGTTDSSDDDELLDSLSIEQDDIPVTGFAVASNKRNADFHELFPSVPEGDYLIEGELHGPCCSVLD